MLKKRRIVKYTTEELAEKRRTGETYSDWARAAADQTRINAVLRSYVHRMRRDDSSAQ